MCALIESTTVIIPVKQKTADLFTEVLDCPMSLLSETRKKSHRWKLWSTFQKKAKRGTKNQPWKFTSSILEDKIRWNIPIEVIPIGINSEVIFTISKTDNITEQQFMDKIREAKISMINMIKIIEYT